MRTDGWCGTTNDWAVRAHGQYASIEDAWAAIEETFGDVRATRTDDVNWMFKKFHIVENYKIGEYEPMTSQETADWANDAIEQDIQAETTDERIAELVADYEEDANSQGYTLRNLEGLMKERRQELRDS